MRRHDLMVVAANIVAVVALMLAVMAMATKEEAPCDTQEIRDAVVELGFQVLGVRADVAKLKERRAFVFDPDPAYNAPEGEKPWVLPDVKRRTETGNGKSD